MKLKHCAVILVIALASTALGQSSGGSYTLSNSVIGSGGCGANANGGCSSSTGSGNLSLDGTVNEVVVGDLSSQLPFSLRTGFGFTGIFVAAPTITKQFGAATIPFNGTTSLSFRITNPNSLALTDISFTDTLPSGLVVAGTPNASNTCSGTFNPMAGDTSLSLSAGTVSANSTCTLSVDVKGTSIGVKNNITGNVSSTEGGTGTTSNTATLTVNKGDQTITFGAAPAPTYLGGNFTVSANTTNSDSSTLTYSRVSGPCALVSGAAFSSNGAGICVVQADGASTTNFNAASNTQNVTIAKVTPTVTF
ncbi:MAG: hypothetical protein ABR607_13230, partial [Pyrinomonadaceae bacterium]